MRSFLCLLFVSISFSAYTQQTDSSYHLQPGASFYNNTSLPAGIPAQKHVVYPLRSFILPSALIAYGVIAINNEDMKEWDMSLKNEVRKDADFKTKIDNYMQYAPALAVYGLNIAGIKGRHNFRDRSFTYLLSNAIMGITVQSLKKINGAYRPDGHGSNAFPSGHTATAFAAAEFLHQEYKNSSPWISIAGYLTATATGILRMYNNRHWFRDIVAGAGFGIMSTQIAYNIEPVLAKKLFPHKYKPPVIAY